MSYALRNTLLLLAVFLLIAGGGISYVYFIQNERIEELEDQLEIRTQELQRKNATAQRYEPLLEQYEGAQKIYENFDKSLMPGSNSEQVFDFLRTLNSDAAYTELNFDFSDSTAQGQYGIVNSMVNGRGNYSYLYNFVRAIEYSSPINKIVDLEISPVNQIEQYSDVTFTFKLQTYYNRGGTLESSVPKVVRPSSGISRNPFFPLIREPEPNNDNLTDPRSSRLIAVTPSSVFLRNQNGKLANVRVGESVYLGSLRQVNIKKKTATFVLNVGGIIETVTLGVEKDEEDETN